MSAERLTILFNRFLDKTITAREKSELAELALMNENQETLHSLLERAWDQKADYEDLSKEKTKEILDQILKKKPEGKIRTIWIRRAAIAALFAGLIFGTYLVFKPEQTENSTAKETSRINNILPGTNRATLTLGNGVTMILDSEANGALAQQGSTKITKLDSGRLAYTLTNQKPGEIVYNTLSTPRGGQYQLILPDGTKAWLNAASSITYPTAFSGSQRLVKMTGEVYFEVVHNSKMPFVVLTNDQVITDMGTSFNVNAYRDESTIATTLISGIIKIINGPNTNILSPGQQETFQNGIVRIHENVDIARVIAWQRGLFEFNQTALPAIMRQISRWYDIDIKYEGPITTETFGGGISRNLPLSDVLKLLEANGVKFRLEGKQLFVSYNQTK